MLKPKSEIDAFLIETTSSKVFDGKANSVVDYVYTNHGVPKGETNDFISGRKSWSDANEVMEYCVIEAIAQDPTRRSKEFLERLKLYQDAFTKAEKSKYSKWKYKSEKIDWPVRIPCFPVTEDQWIGHTTMKDLILMGEAQLIRYNENAQRIMRKKLSGGKEVFVPNINKKAVNAIARSYKEKTYIPNTITLNIPEDVEVTYHYDKDTNELVFDYIQCLDITDGYHRYLGACKVYAEDKDFDTPIELRITQFSDEKARGFIYQEDQKTKMTKVESNSMNVNAPANIIVEKLNSSPSSNLKDLIKRNGGIVDYPQLVSCIDYYFLSNQSMARSEIIKQYKIVEDFLNFLSDNEPSLLEKEWSYNYILASILVMKYLQDNAIDIAHNNINKLVVELSEECSIAPSKRINSEGLKKINALIGKKVVAIKGKKRG